jgi:predicted hotdog family 3-hydroxylacyl-ACP dehydratase
MNAPVLLDHDAIASRIPHAGPMCLLDSVVSWDENHIECTGVGCPASASSPHPLAEAGRLPATAAIEYAGPGDGPARQARAGARGGHR